jgi:hypothetical protein
MARGSSVEQRRSTSETGDDEAAAKRAASTLIDGAPSLGRLDAAPLPNAPHVRRFALDLPRDEPRRAGKRWVGVAAVLAAVALVLVALTRSFVVRTLLPVALALVAVGILLRTILDRRRSRRRSQPVVSTDELAIEGASSTTARAFKGNRADHPIALTRTSRGQRDLVDRSVPDRSLEIDDATLTLVSHGERKILLAMSEPFGMTILSNRRRDRVVLALTSRSGSFLLGGRVSLDEKRSLDGILARASVIPTDEVALDAIGPDGKPIELTGEDFKSLVESLDAIDPAANDRLLLSDPSGAPLELQGEELIVRSHHFDLTRPLEWRSILFQESFGQAFALYQGTWIRQGASEVVLVSLLPASVLDPNPLDFETAGHPDLDVRAMRDQRLMQATAGAPPPNEQRVAVDGIFMLPLRVALDQAPRSSQLPTSARHA